MSDVSPELAAAARAAAGDLLPARPYPGFRPFSRNEWPIFFGRERQVTALVTLLAAHHFVCVHGPSGSGKSSLFQAGLLASLTREHARLGTDWRFATFRPGATPLWNLAEALLRTASPEQKPDVDEILGMRSRLVRPGGTIAKAIRELRLPANTNLLLVADQFEELFRFRDLGDATETRRFVDLLLGVFDEAPRGIHVAVAMRSDFLGDCASMPGLAEAVNACPYLIPSLTDAELVAAIRGPAELFGGSVDNDLIERMLKDSATESDRLPVLQHLLMRCWQNAEKNGGPPRVTQQVYEAVGKVENALDWHAEEVMGELGAASPHAAGPDVPPRRGIFPLRPGPPPPEPKPGLTHEVEATFRALAELDPEQRAIRRPVSWAQLLAETAAEPARLATVVRRFAQPDCGFLSRPRPEEALEPETMVDIAHEALIRHWRKLSVASGLSRNVQREGWLWEDARDAWQYRRLLDQAQDRSLIVPAQLDERLSWWRSRPHTTAWARRMKGKTDATDSTIQDDLRRIEELLRSSVAARRNGRRMKWAGSLSVIVMLVTGVLLWKDKIEKDQRLEALPLMTAQNLFAKAESGRGEELPPEDRALAALTGERYLNNPGKLPVQNATELRPVGLDAWDWTARVLLGFKYRLSSVTAGNRVEPSATIVCHEPASRNNAWVFASKPLALPPDLPPGSAQSPRRTAFRLTEAGDDDPATLELGVAPLGKEDAPEPARSDLQIPIAPATRICLSADGTLLVVSQPNKPTPDLFELQWTVCNRQTECENKQGSSPAFWFARNIPIEIASGSVGRPDDKTFACIWSIEDEPNKPNTVVSWVHVNFFSQTLGHSCSDPLPLGESISTFQAEYYKGVFGFRAVPTFLAGRSLKSCDVKDPKEADESDRYKICTVHIPQPSGLSKEARIVASPVVHSEVDARKRDIHERIEVRGADFAISKIRIPAWSITDAGFTDAGDLVVKDVAGQLWSLAASREVLVNLVKERACRKERGAESDMTQLKEFFGVELGRETICKKP